MKLEEGKYYVTRDGSKVGPMNFWLSYKGLHPWESGGFLWSSEGINYEGWCPELDIVAEWEDKSLKKEEPTLSGKTLDHLAIDSLKWHYKDKNMEPTQLEAFRIVLRYYGVPL